MKLSIRFILSTSFFAVSILVLIFIKINTNLSAETESYLRVFSVIYIIIGLLALLVKFPPFVSNLFLSVASVNVLYIGLELIYFIIVCFTGDVNSERVMTFFSDVPAKYDPILGYKWSNSELRVVRIAEDGTVVFDSMFKGNNFGFPDRVDFTYKNTSPKRYIVLGDSFTAGFYLNPSWVGRVREIITKKGTDIELYNFAIDGGGLKNWYNIFKKLIVPEFQFDGIIIAAYQPFSDNFVRPFMIFHGTSDGVYYKRFDTIPKGEADFKKNYFPEMIKICEVLESDRIDDVVSTIKSKRSAFNIPDPNLYLLKRCIVFISRWKKTPSESILNEIKGGSDPTPIIEALRSYNTFLMIDEIMNYCKENDKEIIFALIPSLEIKFNPDREKINIALSKTLVNHYNIKFFNGYEAFSNEFNNIEKYYLEYDPHWNQKGSDKFAEHFADFLLADTDLKK